MKFSKNLRQRLSQSPVGKLRGKLSRSPAPAAIAEEVGGGALGQSVAEGDVEKGVKFVEKDGSMSWLKAKITSSPDDRSAKKRRLKDRLPTPKLVLKPKEEVKGVRRIRDADQAISWKGEAFKLESAASFPEVSRSVTLPRKYSKSSGEADDAILRTFSSTKELKAAPKGRAKIRASNSLNDVSCSSQPPMKPPRTFQNRPPWRN